MVPKHSQHPRRPWLWLLGTLAALFIMVIPAVQAQNYSFQVPELDMQVHVQPDASARLVYDITFQNNPDADLIDIVDIGLPHNNYSIRTMQASINGQPLDTIRTSEYIDTGVEIPLGLHAIPPGERGTLHFECTMPDMVYQDTTNDDNASLQITPTWFDHSFVTGSSLVRVTVSVPPGIQTDELLYHNEHVPFSDKRTEDGRAVAVWEFKDFPATRAYEVGLSFPKREMDRVIEMSTFDLAVRWLSANPAVWNTLQVVLGIAILYGIFRLFGKNAILSILLLFLLWSCAAFPEERETLISLSILCMVFLFYKMEPRKDYLPPIAEVEGGGIKRGLTAAEAAVLLEIPPAKVLLLVVFGMLKKGMLRQTEATPLTVEVAEDFRGQDRQQRLRAAQQRGVVFHTYEHAFLDEIQANTGKPLQAINFKKAMKGLVDHAVKRMEGFDLSDTQDYYRRITARSLVEALQVGDIAERDRMLNRNLEWVLMNENYRTPFEQEGYRYIPSWQRHTYGTEQTGAAPTGGTAEGGGSSGGTSFGDVAASFAGWTENTMGNIADKLTPSSIAPPPPPSSGGGGGSGCACACAGCACACACAGGGR